MHSFNRIQQESYTINLDENEETDDPVLIVTVFDGDEAGTENTEIVFDFADAELADNFELETIDGLYSDYFCIWCVGVNEKLW